MSRPLFSWRHAVLRSAALSATSKHVLLTLSCHMNDVGGGCYPSIDTLAAETSLSCRAVSGSLNAAEVAGFVQRTQHGLAGQKWRRNEYTATFPDDSGLHYGIIPWTKSASDRARQGAKKKVANALKSGELQREPCAVCGEANTVAHHHDYTLPLDVWWLCHTHHRCLHAAEKNGAKVGNEDQHVTPLEVTNDDQHLPEKVANEGQQVSGKVTNEDHEGGDPRSTKVTNDVPTNSTVNSTNNSTGARATESPDDVFLTLALKGDQTHPITVADMTELATRFPGIDVPDQLRRMESWCQRNLEKRPGRSRIDGFIERWFQRQRERQDQKAHTQTVTRSLQRVDQHIAGLRAACNGKTAAGGGQGR